MDKSQFAALMAQAAITAGVSCERIGLSISSATGRYAVTTSFPAELVEAQPAGTVELGTRTPAFLVATLTHSASVGRKLYCLPIDLTVFRVYW